VTNFVTCNLLLCNTGFISTSRSGFLLPSRIRNP